MLRSALRRLPALRRSLRFSHTDVALTTSPTPTSKSIDIQRALQSRLSNASPASVSAALSLVQLHAADVSPAEYSLVLDAALKCNDSASVTTLLQQLHSKCRDAPAAVAGVEVLTVEFALQSASASVESVAAAILACYSRMQATLKHAPSDDVLSTVESALYTSLASLAHKLIHAEQHAVLLLYMRALYAAFPQSDKGLHLPFWHRVWSRWLQSHTSARHASADFVFDERFVAVIPSMFPTLGPRWVSIAIESLARLRTLKFQLAEAVQLLSPYPLQHESNLFWPCASLYQTMLPRLARLRAYAAAPHSSELASELRRQLSSHSEISDLSVLIAQPEALQRAECSLLDLLARHGQARPSLFTGSTSSAISTHDSLWYSRPGADSIQIEAALSVYVAHRLNVMAADWILQVVKRGIPLSASETHNAFFRNALAGQQPDEIKVAMSVLDALLSRQSQLSQQRAGPSPSSEPDIVSSAIVYQWIDLYALKLRDQRGLATLLGKLQKAGVELDTHAFHLLLLGMLRTGAWTRATALLSALEQRSMKPEAQSYAVVINTLVRRSLYVRLYRMAREQQLTQRRSTMSPEQIKQFQPDLSDYDTRFFAREPSMLAMPVGETEDSEQLLEQARTILLHMQAIGYGRPAEGGDEFTESAESTETAPTQNEPESEHQKLLLFADGSLAVDVALPSEVEEQDDDVEGLNEDTIKVDFSQELDKAQSEWAAQQQKIFAPVSSTNQAQQPTPVQPPASTEEQDNVNLAGGAVPVDRRRIRMVPRAVPKRPL